MACISVAHAKFLYTDKELEYNSATHSWVAEIGGKHLSWKSPSSSKCDPCWVACALFSVDELI